jgi:aconitate hydratase
VLEQALQTGLTVKTPLIINPGSEQVRLTAERDGLLTMFEQAGATLMANACGPCIGQWKRVTETPDKANSILTSFNRNFAKRNDGNPNTHAFVSSPEIVAALSIAGNLRFNPIKDTLMNKEGAAVKLDPPQGREFPPSGYQTPAQGFIPPNPEPELNVSIAPGSERLQVLHAFAPWEGSDLNNLALLIKVKGKCTTDHISMAGPWLRFRGHLDNISDNLLMGAVNAFNERTNAVLNPANGSYEAVSAYARKLKAAGIGSVVVAEENYGEGSSREHAAMEPRHLNVRAIIVKSFARIHETNLKKQGMLALTFADKADYDLIREDDSFSILGLTTFSPGQPLTFVLHHVDGSQHRCQLNHTYNQAQIEWFKAGSALNGMASF